MNVIHRDPPGSGLINQLNQIFVLSPRIEIIQQGHEVQSVPRSPSDPTCRYGVFTWGLVFFSIAMGCLCFFWCCSAPPGYDSVSYTVSGSYGPSGIMGGGAPMAMLPVEAQPLFHPGMQYNGGQYDNRQYDSRTGVFYSAGGNGGRPLPPAYQFSYQYPAAAQYPVQQVRSFARSLDLTLPTFLVQLLAIPSVCFIPSCTLCCLYVSYT